MSIKKKPPEGGRKKTRQAGCAKHVFVEISRNVIDYVITQLRSMTLRYSAMPVIHPQKSPDVLAFRALFNDS
ncbi:hypothetical protein [Paraburkholderia hayleyella]|uniref:hypothetical protein n=1 Tax=Paraburkholderia hayleyella TaxID=2152889 RepID=UPI001292A171|nr:hypothetical protein [Paraburkholderia hayleyella]